MIHTAKQLKDKVRNISKGDSNLARTLSSFIQQGNAACRNEAMPDESLV